MMHSGSRNRQQGWLMMEMLIVVAVIAIGMIYFFRTQTQELEAIKRQSVAATMANEMAIMTDAARRYIDAHGNEAAWAVGEIRAISVADLQTAGLLPPGFAQRPKGNPLFNGVTPMGQRYRAIFLKDGGAYNDAAITDGKVRAIVTDFGAVVPAMMERSGVLSTAAGIDTMKREIGSVASKLQRSPAVHTGVVPTSGVEASGVSFSFTQDLTWFLQPIGATDANATMLVSFVNFPNINGDDGSSTPNGPGYTDIEVIDGMSGCAYPDSLCLSSAYVQPTCTEGREQIAEWPTCKLGYHLITSAIGTISGGAGPERTENVSGVYCDLNGNGVIDEVGTSYESSPAQVNTRLHQIATQSALTIYESQGACKSTFWQSPGGLACPQQYQTNWNMSLGAKNLLCGRKN